MRDRFRVFPSRLVSLLTLLAALLVARPAGAVAVAGTNGDFDVTITGTKISIKYTPKASANCAKIVFVQSCLTKVDGAAVKPSDQNKKWKYQDDDTANDGKTCVDHVTCEADPYYNGDDAGKDGGKQGDSTSDPRKAAEMSDKPSPQVPAGATSVEYVFETCAYCPATGTYLDCIQWKTTNNGTTTTTTLITGANASAASDEIKQAKTKFDTNHTKGDGTKFSQEATTAAGGKKFDATVNTGAGLTSAPLPPGSLEAGPNLIELLQGTSPTQHTIQWRFEPIGSVSGITIEGGRRVLTVHAKDEGIFTGNPYGPPGQMQLACWDPAWEEREPLLSAVVLEGNWSAIPGPDAVTLTSPNMSPGGVVELRFDLGPVAPAVSPVMLVALLAALALAAAFALRRRRAALLVLFVLGALALAGPASAQISPFPAIVEGSPGAYGSHLVKLTYMGEQKKSVASLGLHTVSRPFTLTPFVPFYRPGHDYDNDGHADRTAVVTSTEISAIVDRLGMFPSLTDISDMPDPFLSVAITKPDGMGGDIVWEGLYSQAEATQVIGILENRLLVNPSARAAVLSFKINCFGL